MSLDFFKNRKKRSTFPSNLNYKLRIEGDELVVQLFPNNDFISPNLIIQRWSKTNRTKRKLIRRKNHSSKGIIIIIMSFRIWRLILLKEGEENRNTSRPPSLRPPRFGSATRFAMSFRYRFDIVSISISTFFSFFYWFRLNFCSFDVFPGKQ